MNVSEDGEMCGLPSWAVSVRKDTATAEINNILVAAVNGPFAIFAFLSNLAVIVTVIKNPSLQKPCNILLCGLAFTDCLTGVTAQPLFIVLQLLLTLQRARQSCLHLVFIFNAYHISHWLTVGSSFLFVLIISFDRHYAVSKPLVYISNASKKGAMKTVIFAGVVWVLFTLLNIFVLPGLLRLITISICCALFLVVPTTNYIRTWFAIRGHNSQIGDAVAPQQMSGVFQREKKVALDMCIVGILLFAFLMPSLLILIIELLGYPQMVKILGPWSWTISFISSSINSLIYFARNKNLRNAFKSMIKI